MKRYRINPCINGWCIFVDQHFSAADPLSSREAAEIYVAETVEKLTKIISELCARDSANQEAMS